MSKKGGKSKVHKSKAAKKSSKTSKKTAKVSAKLNKDKAALYAHKIKVAEVANEVRELTNWVAVFSKEYNMPDEVTEKILEKLDNIGKRLGNL